MDINDKIKKLSKLAIDKNGKTEQSILAIEEMAELTQAITRDLRGKANSRDNIVEELADVEFTLNHIKNIYNISDKEINEIKEYKYNRTVEAFKILGFLIFTSLIVYNTVF